jgi:hypothetical protein
MAALGGSPSGNAITSGKHGRSDDHSYRGVETVILSSLAQNLGTILNRIEPSHLLRYGSLQRDLRSISVASDQTYQKAFNGFYRMGRRRPDWYQYFFAMLEREKNSTTITFKSVLETIHADHSRVEPSFSSKLVSTIRPELPVYDRYVRENLSLNAPPQYWATAKRITQFVAMYDVLQQKMNAMIGDPIFISTLKAAFDQRFPSYTWFTDIKKLDFLLWQHRPA